MSRKRYKLGYRVVRFGRSGALPEDIEDDMGEQSCGCDSVLVISVIGRAGQDGVCLVQSLDGETGREMSDEDLAWTWFELSKMLVGKPEMTELVNRAKKSFEADDEDRN